MDAIEQYRGAKVLVAGGLGFIGLNLVKALLKKGAHVIILNRSAPPRILQWLDDLSNDGDYTLLTGETPLFPEQFAEINVVFNLAGRSGASRSLIEAHSDMQNNIEFHLALLEAIRKASSFPRLVFTSSRLVYGQTGEAVVDEVYPTQPTSLYGLHKLTTEHYHRLYNLHYGLPSTILRLTNPYGPYQSPEKKGYGVINQFIMMAVRGETISIFGDGKQLRDYIFIDDVVNALMLAGILPEAANHIFNIGYGRSISLIDIAKMIVEVAGKGHVEQVPWPKLDQKVETGDFMCSVAKARQRMDWLPETDWKTGLKQSIDQYERLLT